MKRWMEIDKALFDAFNEFELDDLSFFNEVDRHYEQSEVTEATLNRRAAKPQESVEETVSQRMEVDKLHQAIAIWQNWSKLFRPHGGYLLEPPWLLL